MGLLAFLSDTRVLAILAQTGGEIISDVIKSRYTQKQPPAIDGIRQFMKESDARMKVYEQPVDFLSVDIPAQHKVTIKPVKLEERPADVIEGEVIKIDEVPEGQAAGIATGCIPCTLGHFNTCSGLLNEAVRFAGRGMGSPEVADRANMCLEELNSLERVDLRPAMIKQLDNEWEQGLSREALEVSRNTRHMIEGMKSPDDLINAAAILQTKKQQIARDWFRNKLQNLPPEDQEEINRRLEAKIKEIQLYEDTSAGTIALEDPEAMHNSEFEEVNHAE